MCCRRRASQVTTQRLAELAAPTNPRSPASIKKTRPPPPPSPSPKRTTSEEDEAIKRREELEARRKAEIARLRVENQRLREQQGELLAQAEGSPKAPSKTPDKGGRTPKPAGKPRQIQAGTPATPSAAPAPPSPTGSSVSVSRSKSEAVAHVEAMHERHSKRQVALAEKRKRMAELSAAAEAAIQMGFEEAAVRKQQDKLRQSTKVGAELVAELSELLKAAGSVPSVAASPARRRKRGAGGAPVESRLLEWAKQRAVSRHSYRWHLGCILLKMTAVSLRTGAAQGAGQAPGGGGGA